MPSSLLDAVNAPALVGAEVIGLDLSQDLDGDTMWAIQQLINERAVICFRSQKLTPAQHLRFLSKFGELRIPLQKHGADPEHAGINYITNIKKDGQYIGIADAGRNWHSDAAYMARPNEYSMLFAVEIPPKVDGKSLGNTLFASTRAAYDDLSEELKQRLKNRRAIHNVSIRFQRNKDRGVLGRPELSPEEKARTPDRAHPLFRTHHRTGRKSIFVNPGHSFGIEGLDESEAQPILQTLFEHCTQSKYIYEHEWEVGDVILWDNIPLVHRVNFDYPEDSRRLIQRAATNGPVPY